MLRGFGGVSTMLALLAASSGVGCTAQAVEQQRSLAALERAQRALDDERQRLFLIEQRLVTLEAAQRLDASRAERLELERLVEELQLLLVASERSLADPRNEAGTPNVTETGAGACPTPGDPRAQLRYWLERLRNDPAHAERVRGGHSPAQLEAVNALSRGERSLEPQNPWPGF